MPGIEYFWVTDGQGSAQAHILHEIRCEETEAGTEGEVSVALCGYEVRHWCYGIGTTQLHAHQTKADLARAKVPVCPACLERSAGGGRSRP